MNEEHIAVALIQNKEIYDQRKEKDIFLNRTDCCYDRTPLNLFIVLLLVGSIVVYTCFDYGNYYLLIPIGVFVILYLVDVFTSNTMYFINNSMPYSKAEQKILEMMKVKPEIRWTIQNYHYEERSRTVSRQTDHGTEYSTEYYTEKVNTHYANELASYSSWEDVSNLMDCIKHLPLLQYCRLYIDKGYGFTDLDSRSAYESKKSSFIAIHHTDTQYDFHEKFELSGIIPRICTYGSNGKMPWIYSMGSFLLFTLFGLGWIIRILLYKNSFAAKANIIKAIKF